MNVRHFDEGWTGEIIKILLTAGSIPYKYLTYYDANLETLRKIIRKYVKEGVFVKTKYFKTKDTAILLCPVAQIPGDLAEAVGKEFLDYYAGYAVPERERAIHQDGRRAEKNAEAIMMAMATGIPVCPLDKEPAESRTSLVGKELFYSAREFKCMNTSDYKNSMTKNVLRNEVRSGRAVNQKMMGSRITGLYISDSSYSYAVYVVGKSAMQWSNRAERATIAYANERLRERKRGLQEVTEAIFTYTGDACLDKIFSAPQQKRSGYLRACDKVYNAMYFLPRDRRGTALWNMMRYFGWQNRIRSILIDEEDRDRTADASYMCDGWQQDGTYVVCFCVPDLRILYDFYQVMNTVIYKQKKENTRLKVICYDFQRTFIETAFKKFDGHCEVEVIPFWSVEKKFFGEG